MSAWGRYTVVGPPHILGPTWESRSMYPPGGRKRKGPYTHGLAPGLEFGQPTTTTQHRIVVMCSVNTTYRYH